MSLILLLCEENVCLYLLCFYRIIGLIGILVNSSAVFTLTYYSGQSLNFKMNFKNRLTQFPIYERKTFHLEVNITYIPSLMRKKIGI